MASPKKHSIAHEIKVFECFAVFREMILSRRGKKHRNANAFRAFLTKYWRKSAPKNRIVFDSRRLSIDEIIKHLALFVSRLWQIHIFGEGNTRTTAVFFIKYLKALGFNATNDIFAENAWYFRNALVRANYNNLQKGVHETTEFLELFLRNLLLNENNELKNRFLHIKSEKPNIQIQKPNIETEIFKNPNFTIKTKNYIINFYASYKEKTMFSKKDVMNTLDLKPTAAYDLIQKMIKESIIEAVTGHGKGKYRFKTE